MIYCVLCKTEYVFTTYLCQKCQRVKHLMNIYSSDRVMEVLDSVLVRTSDQQNYKVKTEVSKIVKDVVKDVAK